MEHPDEEVRSFPMPGAIEKPFWIDQTRGRARPGVLLAEIGFRAETSERSASGAIRFPRRDLSPDGVLSIMKRLLMVLSVLAAFGATSAQAAPQLSFVVDFGNTSPGVSELKYAGGSSALLGNNIVVSTLIANGTATNSPYNQPIVGGLLNFSTGPFAGTTSFLGAPVDLFATGGTITLTGGVGTPSIPNGSNLLFTGSFVQQTAVVFGQNGAELVAAVHLTKLNATLASYFGLPTNADYIGDLKIQFNAPVGTTSNQAFTSENITGGTDNVTLAAVPEPGTLVMAFAALPMIGIAAWRRRKPKA